MDKKPLKTYYGQDGIDPEEKGEVQPPQCNRNGGPVQAGPNSSAVPRRNVPRPLPPSPDRPAASLADRDIDQLSDFIDMLLGDRDAAAGAPRAIPREHTAPTATPPAPPSAAPSVTADTDPWKFVTGTRNAISDAEYEKQGLGNVTDRMAELQKRIDEIAAQLADVQASEAQKAAEIEQLKDILDRAIANDTSTAGAGERKTRAQEARARIEAMRGADIRFARGDTPTDGSEAPVRVSRTPIMDAGLLTDYATIGTGLFYEGIRDRAAWKARMIADFGPEIESNIDLIRAESHRIFVETENEAAAKIEWNSLA